MLSSFYSCFVRGVPLLFLDFYDFIHKQKNISTFRELSDMQTRKNAAKKSLENRKKKIIKLAIGINFLHKYDLL